ncbi:hypothetical protein MNBD_GAMMA24-2720 [hydrothermal vent metagenome]|uniref:Uncharacterized protein n=1 Tax=hydrothermal vent metagenome TaxID=652676 RepID=A0A3B1BJ56_9ZZZZ
MSTLNLSAEQTETLKETLTSYLSDLRLEIADTDNHDFRETLKKKEDDLKAIIAMLG